MTNFTSWYDTNRDVFNEKRRARYQKDRAYRKRVQGYTRRYRDGKSRSAKNPDGTVTIFENGVTKDVYRIGEVVKMLKVSAPEIRNLEKQGYIPERPPTVGKRRVRNYTKQQVILIGTSLDIRRDRMQKQISERECEKRIKTIFQEWNDAS